MFPPAGGGGVLRITKFVKFLPRLFWQPFVITPKKPFYPIQDPNLLNELPKEASIKRITYFEPGGWFNWRP
ncbi:MAG: glycosyl transferase family 1, partial [Candidatus Berkelbacteria bacterium]|nr:glycosyl transferase family 1 [Candidatus Berkelbacteria bacterium]